MQNKSRPTIAYLTTTFTKDLINYNIWLGIKKCAQEQNVSIICFPGNPPNSPLGFDARVNVIFNLVSKKNIQILLIQESGIWGHADPEDIKKLYDGFNDFSIVNIGFVNNKE